MAHSFSDFSTFGGLNSDDSDLNINHDTAGNPHGYQDYRYAKNIRAAITSAGKRGAITNVKSLYKITKYSFPYSEGVFPSGTNKCIGTIEDQKHNTVIWFVWNSLGKHQILRFYRDLINPDNPYGEVQQVMCYDFGWKRNTRITSINLVYGTPENDEVGVGDLLYWADPVPKKINLNKGNIVDKHKSWNIYVGKSNVFTEARTTELTLSDFDNQLILNANLTIGTFDSNEQGLQNWAETLNSTYGTAIFAEACDCHLKITEIGTRSFLYSCGGTLPNLMVPDNWYGSELIDRFFDRNKWQPMTVPAGTYRADTKNIFNNVRNRVFQERNEYRYDDLERSALGVWSQIPINNIKCDGGSSPALNYIDWNFTDPLLVTPTALVVLKQVAVDVREQNLGLDKEVIVLDICDFLDWDGEKFIAHYKFYNDIVSTPIDANKAAQQYNDVPLEVGAELFVKNRLIEGDVTTGYNSVECPSADYTIKIGESDSKLYKITGRIRIMTYGLAKEIDTSFGSGSAFGDFFPDDRKYPFWEPPTERVYQYQGGLDNDGHPLCRGGIFRDASQQDSFPFFGGGSYNERNNTSFAIRSGMDSLFDQRIPEGGFPVYAAGKPYLTISKQSSVGLPTSMDGALDVSTSSKITAIGKYLWNDQDVPFDLFSTFELLVPNGVYVIRLASHWCSFGSGGVDKLGKGFNYDLTSGLQYQKTSTNVWAVIDADGNWINQKEITVTVQDGNVFIGDFIVADIAPPPRAIIEEDSDTDYWQGINAYLFDDSGSSDIGNPNYIGTSVELSMVFYGGYVWTGAIALPLPVFGVIELGVLYSRCCITDHNGYWFGIGGEYVNPESPPLINERSFNKWQVTAITNGIIRTTDTVIGVGSLSDFYLNGLSVLNFDAQNGFGTDVGYGQGLVIGVVATNNNSATTVSSRRLFGLVKDENGLPVSGVSVVITNGRTTITKDDGAYTVLVWNDANSVNQGHYALLGVAPYSSSSSRQGMLIFSASIFCRVIYPDGQTIDFIYTSGGGGYPVRDFIISEDTTFRQSYLKRGGKYIVGYREYDHPGRQNSVIRLFELYVPFETEDLSKFPNVLNPATNLPYTAATYLAGKPEISISLDFMPEQFAASYQILLTENTIYKSDYLQWVANTAIYLSAVATETTPEIITSYQNGDAVAIKMSVTNIIGYNASNPGASIGYAYQNGDRVRLIYDRELDLIQGLYDLEVIGYDSATQSIIARLPTIPFQVKSGFRIELYNPKSVSTEDVQVLYEMGVSFPCTSPGSPNNEHSVSEFVLACGDTYWIGRTIIVSDDATKYAAAYPISAESASISDLYSSKSSDKGRAGIIDPTFIQLRQPTTMIACDQFLPGTAINGLSTFDPNLEPEAEIDRKYGEIKRMLFEQNNLVAICSNKEVSNYIQRQVLYQAESNTGVVSLSGDFFGTQYIHAQNLGTDLPATIQTNSGLIFGWNNYRANFWKYQGDGEAVISDIKMITFFKQLQEDGVSDAVSVYDRYHEELITTYWRKYSATIGAINTLVAPVEGLLYTITFAVNFSGLQTPKEGDLIVVQKFIGGVWESSDGVVGTVSESNIVFTIQETLAWSGNSEVIIYYSIPETIAWFEGTEYDKSIGAGNRWKTFYDFTPEGFSALGAELVSFVNGEVWLHDRGVGANNFYGKQYTSKVTPVFNMTPQVMKVYNALWMKMTQVDKLCSWFSNNITNIYGQQSRLKSANFVKKENNWYQDMKRDLTDQTVAQPIINGRELRSEALMVELENNSEEEFTFYQIKMNVTVSERQSK